MQELLKSFVPIADECNVILWQSGPASARVFRRMGAEGHYGKPFQGVYASAPSGKLLASTNDRDAVKMAAMLRTALEKWEAMDKAERFLPELPSKEAEVRRNLEAKYPSDGLVLHTFTRDLPREDGDVKGFWAGAWNEDYAWITKDEARSLVPATKEPGARQVAADPIARRLACFHLLDNVRGEVQPYESANVEKAVLALVVEKAEGDLLHLRIEGESRNVQKGSWKIHGDEVCSERGYESTLAGRAVYDCAKEKFTVFEMLARGPRWGGTGLARAGDLAPAPMGVAFRLAETSEGADRVAPAFVLQGKDYFFK